LLTQLRLKNNDNAQTLALALSQQRGDAQLMDLLMAAQFDTGFYRRIRFTPAEDGRSAFERQADVAPSRAPGWLVSAVPIRAPAGVAQVSDGWRALGTLEVASQEAYAHDELWRAMQRAVLAMLLVGAVAAVMAVFVVRRIRRPLDATVEQARSLVEGRYVIVDEPKVPELQRLAAAMNGMVARVRSLFEAHAAQTEALRRQAYCDAATGLPHRGHFLGRLQTLLEREDGVDGGGLVLVRLADPAGLNRTLGRESTDRAIEAIAQVLQVYPDRVADCFVGRLNGADFALCLPAAGMAAETAESSAAARRAAQPAIGAGVAAHVGAVELRRETPAGAWLAQADRALAQSELRAPFAVEVLSHTGPMAAVQGERAWRAQVLGALDGGRFKLMGFPVLDRQDTLVHLECPLRLQLDEYGPFEAAARWLPLAVRSRLSGQIDVRAVGLALSSITRDGRSRAVNLAPSSLADPAFAPQLRQLLVEHPDAVRQLWLEASEAAALEHFELAQDFGRLVRPLGVRFGIEHAGPRLHRIERLYELGLDYIKLDASVCAGVARSEAAKDFVRSTCALLHALSARVYAEGVDDASDAAALWACGVDGITGPWASARQPAG
jgi:EAL domain-containing protein (putative c-di-GMP-specific phosphodiesterase class I)/GGDEF domain-containing protein